MQLAELKGTTSTAQGAAWPPAALVAKLRRHPATDTPLLLAGMDAARVSARSRCQRRMAAMQSANSPAS